MNKLARFGLFWYDFIVGDDWMIAAGVVVVVTLTSLLAHAGYTAWPLLLVGVSATLALSLRRASRAFIRERVGIRDRVEHRDPPHTVDRENPNDEDVR